MDMRELQRLIQYEQDSIYWGGLSDEEVRYAFESIPDVALNHSQEMLCSWRIRDDDTRMFLVGKGARVPKPYLFSYQVAKFISQDTYDGDLIRDVTGGVLDLLFKADMYTRRQLWKFVDYGTVRVCPALVKGLLRNGMREELTKIFSKRTGDMVTREMFQVMLRRNFTSFVPMVDIASLPLSSCFELVSHGMAPRGLALRLFQGGSEIPCYPFENAIQYADFRTVAGVECMLAIGYSPSFLLRKCVYCRIEATSPGVVALFAMIILHPSIHKDKEAKHLAKMYKWESEAEMHEVLAVRVPPEGTSPTEWRCKVLPERLGLELPVDPSGGKAWDAVGSAMWR